MVFWCSGVLVFWCSGVLRSFSPSLGVFSWNFDGFLRRRDPENTFGALGLLCETPAASGPARPKNSKRAHLTPPVLQTPPKVHEKIPREKQEERNGGGKRKKKREILGPPPFGAPPFGCLFFHALFFHLVVLLKKRRPFFFHDEDKGSVTLLDGALKQMHLT